MPAPLSPKLHILTAAQLALWPELKAVPSDFILYGGTAIALQLGHRESVDFDFFSTTPFDPDRLAALPMLAGAMPVQRDVNTLTVQIERGAPVLVSFFSIPELGRIEPPRAVEQNGLRVASLIDLAGMKADVVQKRAEAKDYIDIDALIAAGLPLAQALAAARAIQGPSFNPQITLKALSYFGDGNLAALPQDLQTRLQTAVASVDLEALPLVVANDKPFGVGAAS